MLRSSLVFLAGVAALGLALSCTRADAEESPRRYLMTGSSTVQPIMRELTARLEKVDPSVIFDVEAGGSGRGIKDAQDRKVQVGMSSRDLKPEEKEGLVVTAIARDGVTLVTHRDRDLTGITSDQVRAIYTGKIDNWKALGGPDHRITIINKAEGRATLTVFLEEFGLKNSDIKADVVVGDNAQCVRQVCGDPFAIGYLSIGEALRAAQKDEPIRLLSLDGIEATLKTVQDNTFPLGRTLYLLFPGKVDPIGQRILDYLQSKDGPQLLYDQGFVPLAGS